MNFLACFALPPASFTLNNPRIFDRPRMAPLALFGSMIFVRMLPESSGNQMSWIRATMRLAPMVKALWRIANQ